MPNWIPKKIALDAVKHCLKHRWKPAAKDPNGDMPEDAPDCELCMASRDPSFANCHICPLYILTGKDCGEIDSPYSNWSNAKSTKEQVIAAKEMVKVLKEVKEFIKRWPE